MANFTLGERLALVSYLSRSNKPELQDIIKEQKKLIETRGQELAKSDFIQELLSAATKGETRTEIQSPPTEDLTQEGIYCWKEFVFWS